MCLQYKRCCDGGAIIAAGREEDKRYRRCRRISLPVLCSFLWPMGSLQEEQEPAEEELVSLIQVFRGGEGGQGGEGEGVLHGFHQVAE